METLRILKEEINQTLDAEHDFAKWKLIVTAALASAALGIEKPDTQHLWLLLFVPLVCAYIDLHLYQYQDRILVLAKFIRSFPISSAEDTTLQAYEKKCEELRVKRMFDLGQYANLYASIILSLVAPGLAVASAWWTAQKSGAPVHVPWARVFVWVAGLALVLGLWFHHKARLESLKKQP